MRASEALLLPHRSDASSYSRWPHLAAELASADPPRMRQIAQFVTRGLQKVEALTSTASSISVAPRPGHYERISSMVRHRPQHRRDYFSTAVEIAPPTLQGVAAFAATVAIAFVGHRFVPAWSVVLTLVLGALALICAGLWSWRARHLLVNRAARDARHSSSTRFSPDSRLWLLNGLIALIALIGLSTFILIRGLVPDVSYASPYDGLDPNTSPCLGSIDKFAGYKRPILRDDAGRQVGYIELRRSLNCETVWAKINLLPSAIPQLSGSIARITMVRPGDDIKAPYSLILNHDTLGNYTVVFGNMLSDAQSCVRAEIYITSRDRRHAGPVSTTACV